MDVKMMNKFPSSIVFLYYEDYTYGLQFMTSILGLESVMDQGFAQVFQISETSYLGVVDAKGKNAVSGDTLISLNTNHLDKAYKRVSQSQVHQLTNIELIEKIPLKSFFFQDKEGHRFEIQQFVNQSDLDIFNT